MGVALVLFELCFLVSAFLFRSVAGGGVGVVPAQCERIECPTYDVVGSGEGFEIRRYNSSMWISTQPIDDISLVHAGSVAFYQLFDYIQGKNSNHEKIEMTAPVIIEVKPSDGPFCASSFVVSFFVPKANQPTAPSSETLWLQKWGLTYVAVRQFSGFVKDEDVGVEAAALYASVAGTVWSDAIERSHAGDSASHYIVAQYNSPFEFKNRVNEIWFRFDVEEGAIASVV
ncbi:hypothetical protein SASPL_139560 [Salvia splendens]|uniref:Heme-binding protein 2 n=1 Tax=Salvia splendens TaxID=180675 RepID=A0A8X8WN61_SALSN|nr:heme-binding protein 2-like [Salvia splendens]KAG6398108.1 hypothetical protein SASPL_139560 [Salvia splendens]